MSFDPDMYLKGLSLDYYTDFAKVKQYFAKDYQKIMLKPSKVKDDVIKAVEKYNKKIDASPYVFENIQRMKEAPIIVTGQQPCLLTGPLYVVYKALTTIILAEKVKGVPVFWNASEDDDVEEVNHIWVMNTNLEKIRIDMEDNPFFRNTVTTNQIHDIITRLKDMTPPTEFRDNILNLIPVSSMTLSELFSRTLSKLFSSYGLVMVEPYIFQELAIPLYQLLITNPVTAVNLVNAAGDSLEKGGYKRQLHKSGDNCSFYVISDDKRYNVTFDGKFHIHDKEYTEKELLYMLDEHPEMFTSTVVSRPLIQDFLFHTLAYCAGPGEVSYFAQMKEVYKFFGISEPYIVPRFGATLIEKKVQKTLDKYSIGVTDLMNPEYVIKSLARKDIQEFFDERKGKILRLVLELENYMVSIDGNLKRTGAAIETRIQGNLKNLEERTAAALKNQNHIMEEQIMKASQNVFPNNSLQERVLNVFQYLIRYNNLINQLYTEFHDARPGEHVVINPGG
ncbi:MAG: bacillithiol biosynthesis cysteine-adding enzyme BshC [Theionarchaea archaeon]|nr:bacillithiol biosynthesis cysteine-adding enzyme BshC [Theionarchaea archaeon]